MNSKVWSLNHHVPLEHMDGNTAVCALFVVDVWCSHRTVVFIDLGPNIMSFWWGFQNGKLWFQAVFLSSGKKWLSGYVSGYTHSVEMPNQLVYLKSWALTVNITLLMLLHLHLSSSRTCTTCWILESFCLGKWGQKGRYGSISICSWSLTQTELIWETRA